MPGSLTMRMTRRPLRALPERDGSTLRAAKARAPAPPLRQSWLAAMVTNGRMRRFLLGGLGGAVREPGPVGALQPAFEWPGPRKIGIQASALAEVSACAQVGLVGVEDAVGEEERRARPPTTKSPSSATPDRPSPAFRFGPGRRPRAAPGYHRAAAGPAFVRGSTPVPATAGRRPHGFPRSPGPSEQRVNRSSLTSPYLPSRGSDPEAWWARDWTIFL